MVACLYPCTEHSLDQAFIVKSSTRGGDLVKTIAGRLKIKSHEGFSLFIKMGDKVISIPEGDFFFDFVRQITDWARKSRVLPEGKRHLLQCQLLLLLTCWLYIWK